MKTMLKAYTFILYILAMPVFLVFSLIVIIWGCVTSLRYLGEIDIKEVICAYAEGVKYGHRSNMERIESAFGD